MALNVGDLQVRLGADIRRLEQGLDEARRDLQQFSRQVDRTSSQSMQGLNNSLNRVGETMRTVGRDSARFVTGLAALSTGLVAAGAGVIRLAGQLEQAKIAFETMLGSAEEADRFLRDLADFAARTPFNFQGLQDSSRLLLAFGFQAEQIIPIMRTLGDATSALGGGTPELEGIARALGQIQTKGRVATEELLQLAERGVPAFEILQQQLNLTDDQIANIGKQGIAASDAINALLTGLSERFGGAMERQSQTILGLFSTVQDEIELTSIEIGTQLADALNLREVLQRGIDALSRFRDRVSNLDLRELFAQVKDQVILLGGALIALSAPALVTIAANLGALAIRLGPIAILGAAVARVMSRLGIESFELTDVLASIVQIGGAVSDVFVGLTDVIAGFILAIINSFRRLPEFFTEFSGRLREFRDEVGDVGSLQDFLTLSSDLGADLGAQITSLVTDIPREATDLLLQGQGQVVEGVNRLVGVFTRTVTDNSTEIREEIGGIVDEFTSRLEDFSRFGELFGPVGEADREVAVDPSVFTTGGRSVEIEPGVRVTRGIDIPIPRAFADVTESVALTTNAFRDLRGEVSEVIENRPFARVAEAVEVDVLQPFARVADAVEIDIVTPFARVAEAVDVDVVRPFAKVTPAVDVGVVKPFARVAEAVDVDVVRPFARVAEEVDIAAQAFARVTKALNIPVPDVTAEFQGNALQRFQLGFAQDRRFFLDELFDIGGLNQSGFGGAIFGGIEGFAAGGPIGAGIGVLANILPSMEGFAPIVEKLTQIFEDIIDVLEPVLIPLLDLWATLFETIADVILTVLKPAFEVLGAVIGAITDVFTGIIDFFRRLFGLGPRRQPEEEVTPEVPRAPEPFVLQRPTFNPQVALGVGQALIGPTVGAVVIDAAEIMFDAAQLQNEAAGTFASAVDRFDAFALGTAL